MLRNIDLDEISDGKLYTAGDLAKVGCQDCEGCCDCCCQMGDTIILDPLDVWQLMQGRGKSFEQLLDESLDLHVQDGVILPNQKMAGEKEQCVYLNEKGRCSIHPFRPGICRLFPLGRFYENGVVVAQDGKEARRCYETGEKLGSVKCKMRLARCKLLGIGGRRAKKAGLDLCRQALELAKESSEKEDYGYEAEMNLLRRTIAENES